MPCLIQKSKRYTERPSPPFKASDCPNKTKNGNDGKRYVSVQNAKGVYRWKIKTSKTTKTKTSSESKVSKPSSKKSSTKKPCRDDQVRNPLTGRCKKVTKTSSKVAPKIEKSRLSFRDAANKVSELQKPNLIAQRKIRTKERISELRNQIKLNKKEEEESKKRDEKQKAFQLSESKKEAKIFETFKQKSKNNPRDFGEKFLGFVNSREKRLDRAISNQKEKQDRAARRIQREIKRKSKSKSSRNTVDKINKERLSFLEAAKRISEMQKDKLSTRRKARTALNKERIAAMRRQIKLDKTVSDAINNANKAIAGPSKERIAELEEIAKKRIAENPLLGPLTPEEIKKIEKLRSNMKSSTKEDPELRFAREQEESVRKIQKLIRSRNSAGKSQKIETEIPKVDIVQEAIGEIEDFLELNEPFNAEIAESRKQIRKQRIENDKQSKQLLKDLENDRIRARKRNEIHRLEQIEFEKEMKKLREESEKRRAELRKASKSIPTSSAYIGSSRKTKSKKSKRKSSSRK